MQCIPVYCVHHLSSPPNLSWAQSSDNKERAPSAHDWRLRRLIKINLTSTTTGGLPLNVQNSKKWLRRNLDYYVCWMLMFVHVIWNRKLNLGTMRMPTERINNMGEVESCMFHKLKFHIETHFVLATLWAWIVKVSWRSQVVVVYHGMSAFVLCTHMIVQILKWPETKAPTIWSRFYVTIAIYLYFNDFVRSCWPTWYWFIRPTKCAFCNP